MGALRLPPFIDTATHLGYPTYFMTILCVWYVSAGIVVLAPRLPRLKEWAYAGLIFNYTGAAFSHVWIGDGFEKLLGPVIFIGLTLTSWALRCSGCDKRHARPCRLVRTAFWKPPGCGTDKAVRVARRSGAEAATTQATAAPQSCPTRCTRRAPLASISAQTSATSSDVR
jgi:uncharacterized membrane protein YphA (DoxX/SURF4 family)